jgi:hypothetical protein
MMQQRLFEPGCLEGNQSLKFDSNVRSSIIIGVCMVLYIR